MVILLFGGTGVPAPAQARLEHDAMIQNALRCTRYFTRLEREHGLPPHLLSAISVVETGRHHKGLGVAIPWPWTINAEGRGQYFETKADAVRAVRELQRQGVESIDVGCMQVNLYHHPDAFGSLNAAFAPNRNIAYAIEFLKSHYEATGSWHTAVAHYHSKTPHRGKAYAAKVLKVQKQHAQITREYQIAKQQEQARLQRTQPSTSNARARSDMIVHTAQTRINQDGIRVTRIMPHPSPATPVRESDMAMVESEAPRHGPRVIRIRETSPQGDRLNTRFVFEN